MGFLFKTLAVFAIIAVAYPPINEGVGGPCHALEAKAFTLLSKEADDSLGLFGILGANITTGGMATALMKEEYPSYPPFISCTLMYWLILFDEDSFVEAMGGMVS
ncbi:hypothetical protein N9X50_05455 [Amylibacter sp.]|nr:hypothetical protein [Amylibacter sp.]